MPPEADDARAERVMRTILPAGIPKGALVDTSDSLIGELIHEIREAVHEMRAEREERAAAVGTSARNQRTLIDQQNEILAVLLRTERTTEANHQLQLDAIRKLEKSDQDQDGKLLALHHAVDELKADLLAAADHALKSAARIAALETEIAALKQKHDGQRASTPATAG